MHPLDQETRLAITTHREKIAKEYLDVLLRDDRRSASRLFLSAAEEFGRATGAIEVTHPMPVI